MSEKTKKSKIVALSWEFSILVEKDDKKSASKDKDKKSDKKKSSSKEKEKKSDKSASDKKSSKSKKASDSPAKEVADDSKS